LILLVVFLILFSRSSVFACDIIQDKTSERITFCKNPDGTITVTDRYVNYKGEDGLWHHVDTTIRPASNGWDYGVTKGLYHAYFNASYKKIIGYRVERYNKSLLVGLASIGVKSSNGIKPEMTSLYGNRITYSILKDSEMSYIYLPYRIKEVIKISERDKNKLVIDHSGYSYIVNYVYPSGDLKLYVDGEEYKGSLQTGHRVSFLDSEGREIVYMPRPFAYDSNNTRIDLGFYVFSIDNTTFIAIRIPQNFILNAVYPIYIDPTTSISESRGFIKEDTYTSGANPSDTYGSDSILMIGKTGDSYPYRSFLEVNFSSLIQSLVPSVVPDARSINITEARIVLESDDSYNVDSYEYPTEYCNDTFNESTLTWNNQDSEVTNCASRSEELHCGSYSSVGTRYCDSLYTAEANNETCDDYTFTVKILETGSTGTAQSVSSSEGSNAPYFQITYTYNAKVNLNPETISTTVEKGEIQNLTFTAEVAPGYNINLSHCNFTISDASVSAASYFTNQDFNITVNETVQTILSINTSQLSYPFYDFNVTLTCDYSATNSSYVTLDMSQSEYFSSVSGVGGGVSSDTSTCAFDITPSTGAFLVGKPGQVIKPSVKFKVVNKGLEPQRYKAYLGELSPYCNITPTETDEVPPLGQTTFELLCKIPEKSLVSNIIIEAGVCQKSIPVSLIVGEGFFVNFGGLLNSLIIGRISIFDTLFNVGRIPISLFTIMVIIIIILSLVIVWKRI